MKTFLCALVVLCIAVVAGTIFYGGHKEVTPLPAAVAVPTASPNVATNETPEVKPTQLRAMAKTTRPPQAHPVAMPAAASAVPNSEGDVFSNGIGKLISLQSNFQEKEMVWKQLQEAGELDHAIAELKQRAANSPNDPQVLTALGEAGIYKLRATNDFNEQAILAMQADQNFTAALKLEPANWEAQYYKAASMYHWPASLHKDEEVVQRLSALAAQQETMSPEPQFARTYVVLGDEYQKQGKADEAQQTWQLGSQKFPQDPALQKRLNGKNQ